jgi:hypothetical protein
VRLETVTNFAAQEAQEIMEPQDQKKKPYSPPTLTKLTREQARNLVADFKTCSEEEAAIAFLKSLSQQPPSDAMDQKRKRSA